MAFLTDAAGLLAKKEDQSGTYSDPGDKQNSYLNPVAQDVRIRELTVDTEVAKDDENSKYLDGTFAGDESITGMRTGTISFNVKLAPGQVTSGAGSTYDHQFPMDKYYSSVGLTGIVVYDDINTSALSEYQYPATYVYYPSIENYEDTLSILTLERDPKPGVDAIQSEFVGAYGNMTIGADTVGAPFTQSFDYMAGVENVIELDGADVPNFDFNPVDVLDTVADKFINTTFRIKDLETDSELSNVCVGNFTLDLGVQRTLRDCSSSSSGVKAYAATGFQPRMTLDPELVPLDEFDYWKALTEERFYEIEVESSYQSATGIKVLNYFVPKAQLLTAGVEDDENFRRLNLEWRTLGNKEGSLPTVTYEDATTGTPTEFDLTTVMSAKNIYEAMYILTFKEVPIGFTPVPAP